MDLKLIFFVLTFFILHSNYGQKALNFDRFLEKGDLEKFQSKLENQLEKDSTDPSSYYMLATFLSLQDSSTMLTDSAYRTLKVSKQLFDSLENDEVEKFNRKGLDSKDFRLLNQKIDSVAFKQSKLLNTEASYNHYIALYTEGSFLKQSEQLRNDVAYKAALAANTTDALEKFYQKYPDAEQAKSARGVYETLLYENITSDKSLFSFKEYIRKRPNGPYIQEAKNNVFSILYTAGKSILTDSFLQTNQEYLSDAAIDFIKNVRNDVYNDSFFHYRKGQSGYWFSLLNNSLYAAKGLSNDSSCQWTSNAFYNSNGLKQQLKFLFSDDSLEASSAVELGFGYIKLRRIDTKDFFLRHYTLDIPFNRFEGIRNLDGFLFTVTSKEGEHLFSPLSGTLTRQVYDSIWMDKELVFFNRAGKYAVIPRSDIKISRVDDKISPSTIYSSYKWIDNNVLLFSASHQSLMSFEGDILIPFSKANIRKIGEYWIIEREDGTKAVLNANFEVLFESEFNDLKVDEDLLAIKKDSLWARVSKFDNFFLDYQYDSIRFFQGWATYIEKQNSQFLILKDSLYQIKDSETFQVIRYNSTNYSEEEGRSHFALIKDEKGYVKVYNSEGSLIAEGDELDCAMVAINLLKIKRRKSVHIVDQDGNKYLENLKVKAIGNQRSGYLPILTEDGFQALNTSTFKYFELNSEQIPKQMINDSLFVTVQNQSLGLTSSSRQIILEHEFKEIVEMGDSIVYLERANSDTGFIYNFYVGAEVLNDISYFEKIQIGLKTYFLIRLKSGFGIVDQKGRKVISTAFSAIEPKLFKNSVFWYVERDVSLLGYVVLGLYDENGRLIHSVSLSEEDYIKTLCE